MYLYSGKFEVVGALCIITIINIDKFNNVCTWYRTGERDGRRQRTGHTCIYTVVHTCYVVFYKTCILKMKLAEIYKTYTCKSRVAPIHYIHLLTRPIRVSISLICNGVCFYAFFFFKPILSCFTIVEGICLFPYTYPITSSFFFK